MSLTNLNIVTSGLMFSYDMNNPKSWAGKPTTNYAYAQNARTDSSYTTYSATSSGTWNAKHPDAINVYNIDGSDITGYVNTGVTDWTNTYHAIWTYDYELRKPVVSMRDIDGQWKAKSFGLSSSTPAGMGLSIGSTYSISWLSWSDDIGKCANAGMYMRRASDGSYNFWDGQSNSQSTAFNTKPRTWQRVYAIYTISSGMDINASWSCYMYGHYGNRGTVKIADVQIEAGTPSGFSKSSTRSNTQALTDQTGRSATTVGSMQYNSDGTFQYWYANPSYIQIPLSTAFNKTEGTMNFWVYPTRYNGGNGYFVNREDSTANAGDWFWIGPYSDTFYFRIGDGSSCCNNDLSFGSVSTNIPLNTWTNMCFTWKANNTSMIYKNGVQFTSRTIGNIPSTNPASNGRIGLGHNNADDYFNGKMPIVQIYNRQLTGTEVMQNFQALRGMYGV